MKLINLKCSNCGAILEIEETAKKVKCSYCNATTIIDDEIIKIEHKISNDYIDNMLTNASTYLYKLNKYDDAKILYLKLSKLIPDNAAVWKGIVLAETEQFSKMHQSDVDFELLEDSFQCYETLENDITELNRFEEDFDNYIETYNQRREKVIITLILMFSIGIILTLLVIIL